MDVTQEDKPREDEVETRSAMDSKALSHDSMVTVRLSEPPSLSVDTAVLDTQKSLEERRQTQQSSVTILKDDTYAPDEQEESPTITMVNANGDVVSPSGSESAESERGGSRRGSESSEGSGEEGVNWEELEKTEEQEPRDESSDDVSTRLFNLK
jgi:hypothetical protein